jgi:hypothetical protein
VTINNIHVRYEDDISVPGVGYYLSVSDVEDLRTLAFIRCRCYARELLRSISRWAMEALLHREHGWCHPQGEFGLARPIGSSAMLTAISWLN